MVTGPTWPSRSNGAAEVGLVAKQRQPPPASRLVEQVSPTSRRRLRSRRQARLHYLPEGLPQPVTEAPVELPGEVGVEAAGQVDHPAPTERVAEDCWGWRIQAGTAQVGDHRSGGRADEHARLVVRHVAAGQTDQALAGRQIPDRRRRTGRPGRSPPGAHRDRRRARSRRWPAGPRRPGRTPARPRTGLRSGSPRWPTGAPGDPRGWRW